MRRLLWLPAYVGAGVAGLVAGVGAVIAGLYLADFLLRLAAPYL